MPTAAEKERARKGIQARQDAIKTLIDRHREEFEGLVTSNRLAAGLTPRSSGPSREVLEERIRKQEEKLRKWRQELAQS